MRTPHVRILILGPTASGKSELACSLAKDIGGEIISVDSRQCYRRIDIGTAKPDSGQLAMVPHYNISILEPGDSDSVTSFLNRAECWESDILSRGKTPIYCGGSTLHLQALLQPLDQLPPADPDNLTLLEERARIEGLETLYKDLMEHDPDAGNRMDGLNRHRIYRALDIWMQTGKPMSAFHTREELLEAPDDLLVFGLKWPRSELYNRIEQRVDQMITRGLVEETKQLLREGFQPEQQFLQTVGYRNVLAYLDGACTYEQMIDDIKTATRRYAKRQITWFRRWPFIHWLDASGLSMDQMTRMILQEMDRN